MFSLLVACLMQRAPFLECLLIISYNEVKFSAAVGVFTWAYFFLIWLCFTLLAFEELFIMQLLKKIQSSDNDFCFQMLKQLGLFWCF